MYGVPPSSLEVDGEYYRIDSDFLTALSIMRMYNDEAMSIYTKHVCMLEMLYSYVDEDGEVVTNIPENADQAVIEGIKFLTMGKENGMEDEEEVKPRLMDFEKDYSYIIAAINKTIGRDIRFDDNAHWWTFMGYCQELSEDTLISSIISIRSKLAKGGESSLDKYDKEFYNENRDIIDISFDPEGDKAFEEFMEELDMENDSIELSEEELNRREYDEALGLNNDLGMTPAELMREYNKFIK